MSLVTVAVVTALLLPRQQPRPGGPVTGSLSVSGSQLDVAGRPVQLGGVSRSGSEYQCLAGKQVFDGPVGPASVRAMVAWHVDTVRIPLNEDCWLGINHAPGATSGPAYRDAVAGYVHLLTGMGLAVILDLHWSAPGTTRATGQMQMPDADHAPAFWAGVARRFGPDPKVMFELYNEPHDVSWRCWRDGCVVGVTAVTPAFRAAGMQQLLDAVRGTGATNPVILDGLGWAHDLSRWKRYEPVDPRHSLVAGWHIYGPAPCTGSCWSRTAASVAGVPVLVTEFGEFRCGASYVDRLLPWLDAHHIGYLAWAWDTWSGCSGPPLLQSYGGVPAHAYGRAVEQHYQKHFGSVSGPRPA
ncbi:MAG TPA: cellulase family glycosylhydrolase [Acidimicrobiales bacterium]|nr:cellulase family glycosylhydrolase [Acidimicrobiales bacterium]